jgi:hypothetical protein
MKPTENYERKPVCEKVRENRYSVTGTRQPETHRHGLVLVIN